MSCVLHGLSLPNSQAAARQAAQQAREERKRKRLEEAAAAAEQAAAARYGAEVASPGGILLAENRPPSPTVITTRGCVGCCSVTWCILVLATFEQPTVVRNASFCGGLHGTVCCLVHNAHLLHIFIVSVIGGFVHSFHLTLGVIACIHGCRC